MAYSWNIMGLLLTVYLRTYLSGESIAFAYSLTALMMILLGVISSAAAAGDISSSFQSNCFLSVLNALCGLGEIPNK